MKTAVRGMRSAGLVIRHVGRGLVSPRGRHRQPVNYARMLRDLLVPLIVLIVYIVGALMALMGAGLLCAWVLSFLF